MTYKAFTVIVAFLLFLPFSFAHTAIAQESTQVQNEGQCSIANNRDYAQLVRKLIQNANSSVCILLYQARFYEEHPNSMTNYFLTDLIDARKRNVDVRIVADTGDWNPQNGLKNDYLLNFIDMLTTSGCMIWEDNRSIVSHEKVILIDDNLSLVSSHNWAYYSTDLNNEVSVLVDNKDFNKKLREYFIARADEGVPRANVTCDSLQWEPTPGKAISDLCTNVLPLDTPPQLLDNRDFYTKLAQEILDSSKQITVVQRSLNLYDSRPRFDGQDYPEACPGEPASPTNVLTELIAAAKHRGVDAKVILDIGEGDTGGDSLSNAKKLDAMGITVLEDSKTVQTHAKLVLIDDDTVVLGSTNWTWPALETGNETSVMLKNSVLNNTYLKYVDNTVTSGTVYTGLNDSIWRDAEFK